MTHLDDCMRELAAANRILAHQGVVDAYGHVSRRHPDDPKRFLLSRSRSPELVEPHDIMQFDLNGEPVDGRTDQPYLERFIHAGIYEANPQIMAVVHSHAPEVLPFTISSVPLIPVIHTASACGLHMPVWDIADTFGATNLLVTTLAQGRDLARQFTTNRVVLMRGHGFAAAAESLAQVLKLSIYLPINARVHLQAVSLGGAVKPLTAAEIARREAGGPAGQALDRAIDYWAMRAGCGHLLQRT